MAVLSDADCIKLIKTPKNGKEIYKARIKRERHRLHTETETECDETFLYGAHHYRFLKWVENLLKNDDNFQRFRQLYRPPLPSNELTNVIFSQFQKVFESENKYEKFNFTDSDLEVDAANYRKSIGDATFWETQGFETLKTSVDNILIVDLPGIDPNNPEPQEQDAYPRPYYYFLDIDNLIDIENTKVKAVNYGSDEVNYFFKTEYVIFWEDQKTVCVFDDGFYRTFNYSNGGEPVLANAIPHDLKYCPARSFWTTPLNSKTTILKNSPITPSISKLDWYLAFYYFGNYLKMYAPFPIYAVYKGICTYKDPIAKIKCSDGWLYPFDGTGQLMMAEKSNQRCPRCNKIKVGAGNILEMRAPQGKDEPDLLTNPVKVYPAEEISVKVVNEELASLWNSIFRACVGGDLEQDQKQAKNQDQIAAAFYSKTDVLLGIKKNFETIHNFAMDTIYRLRYGDKYIGVTIDYGDVFFQRGEDDEMQEYVEAKTQQLPEYDLSIRREKINESRYRNNPDMIQRIKILTNLNPFPDDDIISLTVSLTQMPEMIDPVDLCLKVHFNDFINRFEREQANLLVFGSALTFDRKIQVISDILKGYATEYLTNRKISAGKFPLTPPTTQLPPPTIRSKGSSTTVY